MDKRKAEDCEEAKDKNMFSSARKKLEFLTRKELQGGSLRVIQYFRAPKLRTQWVGSWCERVWYFLPGFVPDCELTRQACM